jgi:hypothetical protein
MTVKPDAGAIVADGMAPGTTMLASSAAQIDLTRVCP